MLVEMISKTVGEMTLRELGGYKFIAMTGAKNVMVIDDWGTLRMELPKNLSKCNRMNVIFNMNDTYDMNFYRFKMDKDFNMIITMELKFIGLHADMLIPTFHRITGLRTSL